MKKCVSLLLIAALLLVLGSAGVAAAEKFDDVPDNIWYAPYVYDLTEQGLIGGVGNNLFAPENNIQRAEFAKLLAAMSGDDMTAYSGEQLFNDVPPGQWYTPYVNWAAKNGVVQGTGNEKFEPYANITRQEMMTMMQRYADLRQIALPKVRVTVTFKDAKAISAWAQPGVTALTRARVLDGYSDGTFHPTGNAKRCEAAKIISVFLDRAAGYEGLTDVMILLYHNLSDDQAAVAADPPYNTTSRKFTQDLEALQKLGLRSLSLEKYYTGNYDKSKDYFIITFDDGYLSNYTLAYPILRQHQAYGDIFICTGFSGLSNHFDYQQAAEMEASGYMKIYSHTPFHDNATGYTTAGFRTVMLNSFETIEARLGQRYRMFAYPGGAYNDQTYATLREIGVVMQMVQDLDKPREGDLVNRLSVAYTTDVTTLAKKFFNTSFAN